MSVVLLVLANLWASPLPWLRADARAAWLQLQVTSLQSGSSLTVPQGIYRFNDERFNISEKQNVSISASEGVLLLFSPPSGVDVRHCNNVTIRDFTLDYTVAHYSQATVVSVSRDCAHTGTPTKVCTVDVDVHAGFPPPDPSVLPQLCFFPKCETKIVFFNTATGDMTSPQVNTWLTNATRLPSVLGNRYRLETPQLWSRGTGWGEGMVVAVAARIGNPYQCFFSTGVHTERLTVHASANMAVWELGGNGGNIYSELRIVRGPMPLPAPASSPAPAPAPAIPMPMPPAPRDEDKDEEEDEDDAAISNTRLLVSSFDGFHSEGPLKGPVLRDSTFEHIGDDFFNFHNAINIVMGVEGVQGQGQGQGWQHINEQQQQQHKQQKQHVTQQRVTQQQRVIQQQRVTQQQQRVIVADDSFGSTFPTTLPLDVTFAAPTTDIWRAESYWRSSIVGAEPLTLSGNGSKWAAKLANVSAAFEARYKWGLAGFMSRGYSLWSLILADPLPGAHLNRLDHSNHTISSGTSTIETSATAASAVLYTHFTQVASQRGARVLNNRFHDGLSRVGPVNSVGAVVSGNSFSHTQMGGILVSAEIGWLSGNLNLSNVTVENNSFAGCCAAQGIPYPYTQCNASTGTPFPIYNPGGATALVERDNAVSTE